MRLGRSHARSPSSAPPWPPPCHRHRRSPPSASPGDAADTAAGEAAAAAPPSPRRRRDRPPAEPRRRRLTDAAGRHVAARRSRRRAAARSPSRRCRPCTPPTCSSPLLAPLTPEQVSALQALDERHRAGRSSTPAPCSSPARTPGSSASTPSQFRAFTPQETAASDAAVGRRRARRARRVAPAWRSERSLELGGRSTSTGHGVRRAARRAGRRTACRPSTPSPTGERRARLGAVPDSGIAAQRPRAARCDALARRSAGRRRDAEVEVLRPEKRRGGRRTDGQAARLPRALHRLRALLPRASTGRVLAAIGQVESAHGKHLGPVQRRRARPDAVPAQHLGGVRRRRRRRRQGRHHEPVRRRALGAATYLCRIGATAAASRASTTRSSPTTTPTGTSARCSASPAASAESRLFSGS